MLSFISVFHLGAAISALIFGACVFFTRKSSRLHKQFGYAYVFNMLGLNISALLIYRLTGHFGAFHGAALASLFTLLAGFIPAYLRLPSRSWLALHYTFMNWSYVGLVAAAVSEALTRLPAAPFWPAVLLSSLGVFITGGVMIARGRTRYRFTVMEDQTPASLDLASALQQRHSRATCD